MNEFLMTLSGTGEVTLSEISVEMGPAASALAALRASGWSMYPAIAKGDRLELAAAGVLAQGDIVVFRQDNRLLCHRVKTVGPDGEIVTQGDRSLTPDRPIRGSDIVGKVAAIARAPRLVPARIAVPCDALARRWRGGLSSFVGALARLPGPRHAISATLPLCCRYFAASRAPVKIVEAYALAELEPGTALGPQDVLVARLFGRTIALLRPDRRRVEIHPALAGLGIEERLKSWSRPR